jgi:hypothetical protein
MLDFLNLLVLFGGLVLMSLAISKAWRDEEREVHSQASVCIAILGLAIIVEHALVVITGKY